MIYSELKGVVNEAWAEFYSVLRAYDIDVVRLDNLFDAKDIFNDVMDQVIHVAPLELENYDE